jgi:hypothetical protein
MIAADLASLPATDRTHLATPELPACLSSIFGSNKLAGRLAVPSQIWLTVVFGELKLDLRDAFFPPQAVRLVVESLCGSVEVLLPDGATVVDETRSIFSSHKLSRGAGGIGPVVYVEGWSGCSDVKLLGAHT